MHLGQGMKEIYQIEIFLGIVSLFIVVGYLFSKWHSKRHPEKLKKLEPDLKMMDKPEILSKMPENETLIPGLNAQPDRVYKETKRAK
jgi:hypothetical protein